MISHELGPCVVIFCQDWFQRPDFVAWLNKYVNPPPGERRTATWHNGGEPHEYSDTFILYDNGEGSDFDVLPEDIWEAIVQICEERRLDWALIWLQNQPDPNLTDVKQEENSPQPAQPAADG
jgi:hypothetical protein